MYKKCIRTLNKKSINRHSAIKTSLTGQKVAYHVEFQSCGKEKTIKILITEEKIGEYSNPSKKDTISLRY
jgi:hypothetical protein